MSKIAEIVVRELLDDDNFVNECKDELIKIMQDKKFDVNDMPEVMSLVVLVLEKYDKIKIDSEDVVEVFRLLIIELLKKHNIIENSSPEIEKMLESCLKLLVLKVKTISFWSKLFKCCKSCKSKEYEKVNNSERNSESEKPQILKEDIINQLNETGEIELKINDNESNNISSSSDSEKK